MLVVRQAGWRPNDGDVDLRYWIVTCHDTAGPASFSFVLPLGRLMQSLATAGVTLPRYYGVFDEGVDSLSSIH